MMPNESAEDLNSKVKSRQPRKSLLERALFEREKIAVREPKLEAKLREECELAIAYFEGRVFGADAGRVLGLAKTSQAGAYLSQAVMKGVRHGIIKISMIDPL